MTRTWHDIQGDARSATGRGDIELACKLIAESIDAARDSSLPWFELQSALAASALFHHHVTRDYPLALKHYRESLRILQDEIGVNAREAKNFASCLTNCELDASVSGDSAS